MKINRAVKHTADTSLIDLFSFNPTSLFKQVYSKRSSLGGIVFTGTLALLTLFLILTAFLELVGDLNEYIRINLKEVDTDLHYLPSFGVYLYHPSLNFSDNSLFDLTFTQKSYNIDTSTGMVTNVDSIDMGMSKCLVGELMGFCPDNSASVGGSFVSSVFTFSQVMLSFRTESNPEEVSAAQSILSEADFSILISDSVSKGGTFDVSQYVRIPLSYIMGFTPAYDIFFTLSKVGNVLNPDRVFSTTIGEDEFLEYSRTDAYRAPNNNIEDTIILQVNFRLNLSRKSVNLWYMTIMDFLSRTGSILAAILLCVLLWKRTLSRLSVVETHNWTELDSLELRSTIKESILNKHEHFTTSQKDLTELVGINTANMNKLLKAVAANENRKFKRQVDDTLLFSTPERNEHDARFENLVKYSNSDVEALGLSLPEADFHSSVAMEQIHILEGQVTLLGDSINQKKNESNFE